MQANICGYCDLLLYIVDYIYIIAYSLIIENKLFKNKIKMQNFFKDKDSQAEKTEISIC